VSVEVLTGDCRETLKTLPDGSVNCCVTSPPYFGLRDYGHDGQIGLEQTPAEFIEQLVSVFREVKRVLRDDGTLWLNLGDSYASYRDGKATPDTSRGDSNGTLVPKGSAKNRMASTFAGTSIKHKDLIGIPWRVAFALQSDGWYLRQDIIWHKPNPMPESVTDRCTKAHEYIFLMSKSPRYFFDSDAMQEPAAQPDRIRNDRFGGNKYVEGVKHSDGSQFTGSETRNRRSVWTVNTRPYRGAHFATFPPDLIRPCILAGCPKGGTILDPFGGSGTTGQVAMEESRKAVLCELNPEYVQLIDKRLCEVTPNLWSSVSEAESEPLLFAAQ
jgi:site-specific DNA-methyltransferase (adenine-specific)